MEHDILDKFTSHLRNVLARAYAIAVEANESHIGPVHVLLALALEQGCIGADLLYKSDFDTSTVKQFITKQKPVNKDVFGGIPALDDKTKQVIEKAVLIASVHQHSYVGTEHLLASLLECKDSAVDEALKISGVKSKSLHNELQAVFSASGKLPEIMQAMDYFEDEKTQLKNQQKQNQQGTPVHAHTPPKPQGNHQHSESTSKTPALDFFTTELTIPGSEKHKDPMIGRDKEIERMVYILSRRTKNNPMLLGDPGVGKTAIVEGLALRILRKEVPDSLLQKRILSLDLGLVIAGTMYRGEFEGRIKQIVDELAANPDIILFIDEIHTLIGAGANNGTLDAANMLKPALARGSLRCIGATTEAEFKKHIETDAALERRFQPIHVEEPTPDQTKAILRGIKHKYEQFHHVEITPEAIDTTVELAARYITDRFFPDKAIDILDEASARVAVSSSKTNERRELMTTEEALQSVERKKLQAMEKGDFDTALTLKEKERKLKNKVYALKRRLHKNNTDTHGLVTPESVIAVVANQTGVPIENMSNNEREKLASLEVILAEKVIGQQHVIKEVAQSIRKARLGLSHSSRPMASFLFVGPSGVGKTELAKSIAQTVFGSRDAYLRVDMSEFKEQHNASKLLGAPAGYIGYKEQNNFTDVIRKKPHTLVLFDEIDKAHPDVLNILFQILDDGQVTDGSGKKINFKNTIIIMTAAMELQGFVSGTLGFSARQTDAKEMDFLESASRVKELLKEKFKGELLNRIDKVIVFKPLNKDDINAIIAKELKEVQERVHKLGYNLQVAQNLKEKMLSASHIPEQGARLVRRIISEMIEDPLSNFLIKENPKNGATVSLAIKGDDVTIHAK